MNASDGDRVRLAPVCARVIAHEIAPRIGHASARERTPGSRGVITCELARGIALVIARS